MSDNQECSTRVSRKSLPQECPTKVSCKSAPQECLTRVSHKSVLQECRTRASYKRVSHKSEWHTRCPTRVHKSVPQRFPKRMCPTRGSPKSVSCKSQECQRLFGCLFSRTCLHSVTRVPFFQVLAWTDRSSCSGETRRISRCLDPEESFCPTQTDPQSQPFGIIPRRSGYGNLWHIASKGLPRGSWTLKQLHVGSV